MTGKRTVFITSAAWILVLVGTILVQQLIMTRQHARLSTVEAYFEGMSNCMLLRMRYDKRDDLDFLRQRAEADDYILDMTAHDLAAFPQTGFLNGDRWFVATHLADFWSFRHEHPRLYTFDPNRHSYRPEDVDRTVAEYIIYVCREQPDRSHGLLDEAGPSLLLKASALGVATNKIVHNKASQVTSQ